MSKCDSLRPITNYSGSLRGMREGTLFYISKPFSNVEISYLVEFQTIKKGMVYGLIIESYCTNPCHAQDKLTVIRSRANKCYVYKMRKGYYNYTSCHWFGKLDNNV